MTVPTKVPTSTQVAQGVVVEIVHIVNEYRDSLRAELVRQRTHAWAAFLAIELVTFLLFAFAMNMRLRDPETFVPPAHDPIVGATSLYLVGVMVGIFNWAYKEGRAAGAVEDFGLYYPRLAISSALSGLAAVGGVFLTVMIAGSLDTTTVLPRHAAASPTAVVSGTPVVSAESSPTASLTAVNPSGANQVLTSVQGESHLSLITPGDIYSLDSYPYGLFLAFIFGFSPGLLISRLVEATERAKSGLQSSGAT